MAKRKHGEKSQAVRDILTANPEASLAEVAAAMKEKGMPVTKQLISTVKTRMGAAPKKRGRKKQGKKPGRKAAGTMISLDALVKAKRLVEQFGGIEKAKEAMDALAKLQ